MALQVSTRLWLGGVVSAKRDRGLIRQLMLQVRACALPKPLLFCVDGLATYVSVLRQVFRHPQPRHQPGRGRLQPWRGLYLAQVIKHYAKRPVIAVTQRIVQGTPAAIHRLLQRPQGGKINTAYIERLNATFRARWHGLVRRGRSLARQIPTVTHSMYLLGTVYNFCTEHRSLRLRRQGRPDKAGIAGTNAPQPWRLV